MSIKDVFLLLLNVVISVCGSAVISFSILICTADSLKLKGGDEFMLVLSVLFAVVYLGIYTYCKKTFCYATGNDY